MGNQSDGRRKTERLTEGGRENQEWGAAEMDKKRKRNRQLDRAIKDGQRDSELKRGVKREKRNGEPDGGKGCGKERCRCEQRNGKGKRGMGSIL